VTVLADLLSPRDRARLLERLAELRDLDQLMRQPGTLASPREEREGSGNDPHTDVHRRGVPRVD
jgi:hypothetical protein